MRAFLARLRDMFRRQKIARAFDEEMSFHLAELEERYRARGASPEEARAAAAREFGNTVRAREDLRAQAGFPTWDELASDLRHAWRGIVRRPTLAISVVAILALGLGAAATIHGLIDAVFLRPLPVPHPEELHAVVNRLSRGTLDRLETNLPGHSVAAYSGAGRCTVQSPGQEASRASTRLVNGTFFQALGVAPGSGRLLGSSDDRVGAPPGVVVVANAWAVKTFGTAEAAIGRELTVNRVPVMIVGVLPTGFREISVGQVTDLWFATAMQPRLRYFPSASESTGDDRPNDPDWNREERVSWIYALVRARPGGPALAAALQRAWEPQRDSLISSQDDLRAREEIRHRALPLVPAPGGLSRFRDGFRSTGLLLGGVVAVMLLLVCSNVSGLLLVRSMSRHREIGVRLALGAGSLRVVRLAVFEAVLLSAVGGAGGFLLAMWLLPAAVHLLAAGVDLPVGLGLSSVCVMIGLAALTAALSALAPALWISRVQPLNALSGNRGLGRAPVRLGRILVVAQFAVAVALVALATALGEELQRSLSLDPGFAREQVLTAAFDPPSAGYDRSDFAPLTQRMQATVLGVPGVKAVSFSAQGILAGNKSMSGINVRHPQARMTQGHFQNDIVTPGYFSVIGTPLLRGRELAESDTEKSQHVAVVSASFVREVFGELDPIGQSFGFGTQPSKDDWVIVGVVADVHVNGVREAPPPMFFVAMAQRSGTPMHFLAIRFEGTAAAARTSLRAALARTEPGLVIAGWKTLETRMQDDLTDDLATTQLAAVFGGCAILLAGAGVAGSLGYLVVLRQRELALRMAIGAEPGQVLRGVLADALRLSVVGSALGLLAVWLVPMFPVVKGVLYSRPGVGPAVLAALIAVATALIAGWFPARRASRIDPLLMLKSE